MTIPIIHGDILDEDFGIIVHGVNAQGKMNSGIARDIRNKYPRVYDDYINHFTRQDRFVKVGEAVITEISPQLKIISAVTQKFYGRDPNVVYVNYNAIENIFQRISNYALSTRLPVKFPMIGCGLANGSWVEVERRIEKALASIIPRTLYIKD